MGHVWQQPCAVSIADVSHSFVVDELCICRSPSHYQFWAEKFCVFIHSVVVNYSCLLVQPKIQWGVKEWGSLDSTQTIANVAQTCLGKSRRKLRRLKFSSYQSDSHDSDGLRVVDLMPLCDHAVEVALNKLGSWQGSQKVTGRWLPIS